MINNGVDETPPSKPLSNGDSGASGLNPHSLFFKLEGANVGFKHWHPVSVADKGGQLCGQSDLGGVWEWTSTALEKHEGFEPMELYPAYTGQLVLSVLIACTNTAQRTSSTESTTSPLAVRGPPIHAWLVARHCKFIDASWAINANQDRSVNWYQRNYPFVWAGARIVSDI